MIQHPFKKIFCLLFLLFFTFTVNADIKIQEFDTHKKIHVIFVEEPETNLLTIEFAFKGAGSRLDPTGKEGLTVLMNQLLAERTKPGSEKHDINKKLKNLGVLSGISSQVNSDNIIYSLKVPAEKVKETFAILKTIFTDAAFDGNELEKLKSYDPPDSRLASASERGFASKILIQNMFQGHPYAFPSYGTLDGRQSITLADIEDCAKQRLTRKNLVFSIIGRISRKELENSIDLAFGDLPETSQSLPISFPKTSDQGSIRFITKNSPQTGVVFAQTSVSPKDPDYFPWLILNDIVGGKPFTSRLWFEVREKRGLVYDIRTDLIHMDYGNLCLGSFESDNAKVNEVMNLIREEWKKVAQLGVTEAEFQASKTGLLAGFALNFTTPQGIASYLLSCHLSGMPCDYINQRNALLQKITLADVNRVAKRAFDVNRLSFVAVGDPDTSNSK